MQQRVLIGEQFGSYRLMRLLGEGGQAAVYLGQHVRLANMQAAVKVASTYLSPQGYTKFEEEARTIAGLIHPQIVRLLEFDLKDGLPFLIMDYAPQGTLRQRHPKGTQLSLQQVVYYIEQVASALQYAHDRKVIHRDVKPENLLIGRQGEILLSDFGIATIAHNTSSLHLQNPAGTLRYMALEQFEGRPRPASDQYSLGVIAYEWLAGVPPFAGTLKELASRQLMVSPSLPPSLRAEKKVNISPATEDVIMRALAREPSDRFPTIQAFAQALKDTLIDRDNSPTNPWPSQRSQRIEIHSPHAQPSEPKLSEPQQPSPAITGQQEITSPTASITPVRVNSIAERLPMQGDVDTHPPSAPLLPTRKRRRTQWLIVGLILLLIGSPLGLITYREWGPPQKIMPTVTSTVPPPSLSPTPEGWMFAYHPQRSHASAQKPLTKDKIQQLKQIWTFETGGAISSSPIVDGETVYVGSGDNKLHAINARNGTEIWNFPVGSDIYTPPVVVGDTVYFGTSDGSFYAINIKNQQMRWPPITTNGIIVGFPAVVDNTVYIGSADHNLYAIDTQSGTIVGTFPTDGAIRSSPTVVNGTIYFGSFDQKLYAIDAKSMKQDWSFPTEGAIHSSPVVANGVVYFGSEDNKLYAIDAQNGKEHWEFLTGDKISSSPIVVGNVVYVSGEDSYVYAIDTRNGSLRWKYKAGDKLYSSPVVVDGVLYIGSQDGKLYTIDTQNGALLRTFQTGGYIEASPAVVDGTVYVASWDHKVYAFSIS